MLQWGTQCHHYGSFLLTNAHHQHTHSYFHAASESVTSCVQTYPETCGRDACTIGELCGHWDRVMYTLVPLTCMHGGSEGVVTMTTTFFVVI